MSLPNPRHLAPPECESVDRGPSLLCLHFPASTVMVLLYVPTITLLFTSDPTLHDMQVIGYTLCFGLMGALAVQACVYSRSGLRHISWTLFSDIYFTRFPDDRKVVKTFGDYCKIAS